MMDDDNDDTDLRLCNVWAACLPQQWSVAHRRGTSPKGGAERQRCSSQSKMLQKFHWISTFNWERQWTIRHVWNVVYVYRFCIECKATLQRRVEEKGEEPTLVTVLLERCRNVLKNHRCIGESISPFDTYSMNIPTRYIFTPVVTWGQQVAYRSSEGGWRRQESCQSPPQGRSAC